MIDERQYTILVVDDQQEIREPLQDYLLQNGFNALTAANAEQAKGVAAGNHVDLSVLDISMPGEDGLSLCRYLRGAGETPIIFLTGKDEDTDRIVGLEVGADDYVIKPFNPRELLARIKAILRRIHASPPPAPARDFTAITFDQWRLDSRRKKLSSSSGTTEHQLTAAEYDLLMIFLRHPGRIFSRDELFKLTRDRAGGAFDRTIDNQIRRLRKKVEPEPARPHIIRTVWGRGYCLDVDVQRECG